jgi:hypothetical protein
MHRCITGSSNESITYQWKRMWCLMDMKLKTALKDEEHMVELRPMLATAIRAEQCACWSTKRSINQLINQLIKQPNNKSR